MFRRYEDKLIVNPGSVGLSWERATLDSLKAPWAEYAIINTESRVLNVELCRIPFDVEAHIESILASGMPHAEWLASRYSRI
jgi:hypothetical protein